MREAPVLTFLGALVRWQPGSYRCTPMPVHGEAGWRGSLRDPERWEARCPCCRVWALEVIERYRGADVELRCASGCAAQAIVDRLAQPHVYELEELRRERDALRARCRTLADQAVAPCQCVAELLEEAA